jgi:hypothetical protein
VQEDGTIRLTWKKQVAAKDESRKTASTRFRVIDDADIRHDVAIGHGCDGDDDDGDVEDDLTGQLSQKHQPGEESDEHSVNHDDIEIGPGVLSEQFRQQLSLGALFKVPSALQSRPTNVKYQRYEPSQ